MKFNKVSICAVTILMAASVFAGPARRSPAHGHRGPARGHHRAPATRVVHRSHHNSGAAILTAGVVGLIAGAVLASEPAPPPPPPPSPPQPVYIERSVYTPAPPPPAYVYPRTTTTTTTTTRRGNSVIRVQQTTW